MVLVLVVSDEKFDLFSNKRGRKTTATATTAPMNSAAMPNRRILVLRLKQNLSPSDQFEHRSSPCPASIFKFVIPLVHDRRSSWMQRIMKQHRWQRKKLTSRKEDSEYIYIEVKTRIDLTKTNSSAMLACDRFVLLRSPSPPEMMFVDVQSSVKLGEDRHQTFSSNRRNSFVCPTLDIALRANRTVIVLSMTYKEAMPHRSSSLSTMKRTIASLALLALELTLCFISSKWGMINVKDSEICFKPLLARMNVSSSHHRYLQMGPMMSARFRHNEVLPEHFSHWQTQLETALLIGGIAIIVATATILCSLQCCLPTPTMERYRPWLHLINMLFLTISLIVLITGFYLLQHAMKQPLNGAAALGFFIGILFIVILATHSAIRFWTFYEERESVAMKKEIR